VSRQLQMLREKIESARTLLEVVETMRGLAMVNIRRAEAVAAQAAQYARTVHLALNAALRRMDSRSLRRLLRQDERAARTRPTTVLLISTDMGLCGQFNERVVEYALAFWRRETAAAGADPFRWIVVGLRGWERLRDTKARLTARLDAPGSVEAVGTAAVEAFVALSHVLDEKGRLIVIHNAPSDDTLFAPRHLQLAPFEAWRWLAWPADEPPWKTPPLIDPAPEKVLPYLVREQVYIDLFHAFIQSFAAENAARLASMRNASDNIEELLEELQMRYRRERQDVITNELMELLGGVEAVLDK
jgi:F0F1-type ATP synthase, gamma subunit